MCLTKDLPFPLPYNGEFSTPKTEFATEDGGISDQNEPGLSVFIGFCRISPFYRRRAAMAGGRFGARLYRRAFSQSDDRARGAMADRFDFSDKAR